MKIEHKKFKKYQKFICPNIKCKGEIRVKGTKMPSVIECPFCEKRFSIHPYKETL